MEVSGGGFRFHTAVNEADQVRKMMVAEQPGDGFFAELHAPRLEQAIGTGRNAIGVTKKANVQCAPEHAFIGAEPLEALLRRNGESLIGDRTFRRPQPYRVHAECFLMILARELQLFARVFRSAERAAREWSPGIRDARDVGIAQ